MKYDDVVEKLKQMFPNKKLPNLERLEKEKTELISQIKELNEEYKKIIIELKEIEYAQKSINEYIRTMNKSTTKNELE